MYRSKPRDEEEHLLTERALLLQHKQELERQQAIFGPAYRPSTLPVQIGELERDIRRIDRRIAYVRRKKQLKATMQQVGKAGQTISDAVLPPPTRGRRASRRRASGSSLVAPFVVLAVIIGVFAAVSNARPGLSGVGVQTEDVPLAAALLPEPTAVLLPTMPPVQETAMAVGDWPPSSAERRVIGATGGIGVRLRVEPDEESHSFTGLTDGTLVYLVEQKLDAAGSIWWWVALSDGSTGFVHEKYLLVP